MLLTTKKIIFILFLLDLNYLLNHKNDKNISVIIPLYKTPPNKLKFKQYENFNLINLIRILKIIRKQYQDF